jgi:hypothetical protein
MAIPHGSGVLRTYSMPPPTIIIPDTGPLIHLAAGDLLHVLPAMGRVIIPDAVTLEAIRLPDKQWAPEVAAWLALGHAEIVETDMGGLYQLMIDMGRKPPRNAGEISIIEWLLEYLEEGNGPAVVIYEDRRVGRMVGREPELEAVGLLTTRSFLELAEERRIIPSAEAAWRRIFAAAPTANPVSVRTMKPSP